MRGRVRRRRLNAMNRNTFRNISVMVTASVALLAAAQCFYVWRLYRDAVDGFVRRVHSAAYKSVYRAFRMDAVPGTGQPDVMNIDLDRFDLCFASDLLELDAMQPYAVEVTDRMHGDKVVMSRGGEIPLADPMTAEIEVDDGGVFMLRVHVEVPYARFLNEMWGVIASAAAIVLLLVGAFAYMLRTMFRQKSLGQMRRDLMHNITHELKTPIAVACAACDALRNFSADASPEKRAHYAGMVSDQLARLSSMVEYILTVSAVEEDPRRLSLSSFALRPVLDDVAAGYAVRNAGRHIAIAVECDDGLRLTADRFHLSNVVATLVDNSVKYSVGSVHVLIAARRCPGGIGISVTDDGPGMEPRYTKHIFDKFYRIPTGDVHDVRGFGLGLYYARQVAERHGGSIAVRSRRGAGTTVTITVPDNGRDDG